VVICANKCILPFWQQGQTVIPIPTSRHIISSRQVQQHFLIVQDDGIELMRERKDYMEVVHRQDLVFSFGKPALARYVLAFGTVSVSARVIRNRKCPFRILQIFRLPQDTSGRMEGRVRGERTRSSVLIPWPKLAPNCPWPREATIL